MRRLISCLLATSVALSAVPALAQGAKVSSALELAEAANSLKPGDWVWAPEIAPAGPVTVLVDLTAQLAFIYRNGINIGVSTVSTGKPGHETPTGVFQILQKDANHHSSTYNNAPMYFQERLTWDGVALHAGGLPGYPESHGCVHLPYTFAKELFQITSMGGTVVVTGRAGAPVRTLAGGVLAPVDELGGQVVHRPLTDSENWDWDRSVPDEGPLSIIISTSDQRIVVLRNGQEVGRARAQIDDHLGTHVATLHTGKDGKPHWVLIGVPGHEGEANHALDAMALHKLRLPSGFHQLLKERVVEGTTVLVTSASVGAHNSGPKMTLLAAND
ncbi:L,D-transpeptidase [Croceicoccus gelatinilyticus]|uniref:L,D-transpeptidase n=1 Tax=Croceicoccus gelatinilyticus TaxID=2835536 RepID=UPI001BD0B583|nr:L,D-transpeptidase [Croceicoccus gelatinilyticus]MBS7668726.1 L,D-transpeptidase [Croceicoccus gelatinilyticus]